MIVELNWNISPMLIVSAKFPRMISGLAQLLKVWKFNMNLVFNELINFIATEISNIFRISMWCKTILQIYFIVRYFSGKKIWWLKITAKFLHFHRIKSRVTWLKQVFPEFIFAIDYLKIGEFCRMHFHNSVLFQT